jgi:ABC-type nitrate/sulfonate/bicarbonate transport system ATPase subunit
MPQRGLDASAGLAFEGVVVKLQVKKAQRVVVDGACGRVGGGGLLAVLGASGAGKTTLLAALAGEVACEGLVDRPSGVVAYCPQDDLLLPFLTVGETLRFAGDLRLDRRDPRWRGAADRAARGDALLATLGLEAVAAARVGSRERRGVSGGERKRLALGVELVLMPALLVADEPTSGLDSRSALEVADLLRRAPAAVAASVHQPGARVYGTFTDCLVLAPGGSPAYSGAAAAAPGAVAAAVGAAVPPLTSAAEYLLDAAADHGAALAKSVRASGAFVGAARRPASWHRGRCRAGGGSRFAPLLERAWLNNRRSPVATYAALGRSVTMALLVGALYAGSRGSDGQDAVSDRTGALFFVLINQAFSAMASLRVFVDERAVFEHERRRDAYGTGAYFLAKSLAELPFQGLFAAVFAGLSYVLVGLRAETCAVAAHVAFLVGATLAAESLVLLVGAVAPDAKTAVVVCPVLLSTSLLFGGLFVSLDSLPAGLAVFQKLSLFRWSFAALLKAEFAAPDVVFTCTDADRAALARRVVDAGAPRRLLAKLARGLPCPTPDGATHVARVLGAAGAARSLADDGAALAALVVGFRVLAYFALARRTRGADAAPAKQKAA